MYLREAIILAGGTGTRLRSVVSDVPKPMASIQGKPFLEIMVENFHRKGIDHFIISVGYLADRIVDHFQNKYPDIQISFSVESEALGTGGAIRLAMEKLKGEYALILNGDSLFDVDLGSLKAFESPRLPILFGRFVPDVGRYGHFVTNGQHIKQYVEKGGCGSGYINGGVYVFRRDYLKGFPIHSKFSVEHDVFTRFSGDKAANLIISDAYFIDIGIPESYASAQEELKPYIEGSFIGTR